MAPSGRKYGALILQTSALMPYFAAPFFDIIPRVKLFLQPYLERYAAFLLLFAAWHLLLFYVLKFYALRAAKSGTLAVEGGGGKTSRTREILKLGVLLSLVAAVVITLDFFQRALGQVPFYLALASFAALALDKALQRKGRYGAAAIVCFAAMTTISYLSFLVTTQDLRWQPVLISIGVAAILTVPLIARILTDPKRFLTCGGSQEEQIKSFTRLNRLHAFFLVLSPTALGVLCYFRQLPAIYLAVFVVLTLFYRIPPVPKEIERFEGRPPWFLWRSQLAAAAYVVILIGLGIV